MVMQKRQIGRTGLRVNTVGLGCNNFGWKIGQEESNAVVSKALDAGIDFFDTADMYGTQPGESEIVLGKALGARRKDVVLLTKFGVDLANPHQRDSSRRYVLKALESSLRRLNTDWIDLYMIHWPDHATPMEETLRTLDDVVRAGKVRYIGCSNLEPWRVADAVWTSQHHGLARFIASQDHYNLLKRDAEKDLIPALRHYGLGLIPYFPLSGGLLSGKYSKGLQSAEGRLKDNFLGMADWFGTPRNLKIVAELEQFCKARGRTLLELAVSWLAAQPYVSSVICGATKPEQIEQNIKAAGWQLTADELAEIDRLTLVP
jgi:aryl-alcohol dehydrogenase-like predicted oxidoreductase